MRLLPHWVLTNRYPAFFDAESGTAIEQTAKVYGAMQELIKEYNAFVDDLNKSISEFEKGSNEDISNFKLCIEKTIESFMSCVITRLNMQDLEIKKSLAYTEAHITEIATNIINEKIASGEIQISLIENYNSGAESLSLYASESPDSVIPIQGESTYIGYDEETEEMIIRNEGEIV